MRLTDPKDKAQSYKGYEIPPYAVIQEDGSVQIRLYQPALMAQVQVKGERQDAIGDGFRILAGYIFGGNVSKAKIAMTTPVVQTPASEKIAMTTPVVQKSSPEGWTVQFMMPKVYTMETLPRPKDGRIQFLMSDSVQKAVIRFSGSITDQNLQAHLKELQSYILEKELKTQGEAQYFFYDAPWTLPFMRRNEIAYELV
jgi:hypothetical protein